MRGTENGRQTVDASQKDETARPDPLSHSAVDEDVFHSAKSAPLPCSRAPARRSGKSCTPAVPSILIKKATSGPTRHLLDAPHCFITTILVISFAIFMRFKGDGAFLEVAVNSTVMTFGPFRMRIIASP